MSSVQAPLWGHHSLLLNLPTGGVRFAGLSPAQLTSLNRCYARFTCTDTATPADTIECLAVQLTSPLQIDPQALAADGLYTPLKVRCETGIELTGINFQAQIPVGSTPGQARLGVALEHEFAQPNVVENFLRVLAAHRGLELGGAVLHSAGLVFEGQAYIFAGRSNAGKTTLTRKAHSAGATVLSDDINLVLPQAGGYRAYAVPFTGEFGRTVDHDQTEASYPVAGIVLLEQAQRLAATQVSAANAVARLMVGCPFVNTDENETNTLFDNLAEMVAQLPVIQLQNRREDPISEIMTTVRGALSYG